MNMDKIYAEYAPKDASKIIALKKLDRKAKLPATICAYSLGIIASLIAGLGMCLSMNVIGNGKFILGIVIGIIGFAGIAMNYPLYLKLLKINKQKYAFEIVELAKEISEEE